MRSATVLTLVLPLIAAFPHSPVDEAAKRDMVKRWRPTQGELDGSKWASLPEEIDGSRWNDAPDAMDGSRWSKPAGNRGLNRPTPERPTTEAVAAPQPDNSAGAQPIEPVDDKKVEEQPMGKNIENQPIEGGNECPAPPTAFTSPDTELQPPPEGIPQQRPQQDGREQLQQGQQPQPLQDPSDQRGNQRPETPASVEGANDAQRNTTPGNSQTDPDEDIVQSTHQPTDSATPDSGTDAAEGKPAGPDYMPIVDKWRSRLGVEKLRHDALLENNALNTSSMTNGDELRHQLFPGSTTQLIAPGNENNFENVLLGWLCEVPNMRGLENENLYEDLASKGLIPVRTGETGHAEEFSSTKYTKIGCGLANGVWACDLA